MKHAAIYVKTENRKNDYMELLEFINEHDEWSYEATYKDFYGDEPDQYDTLIDKALNGEIDIIVTDSVARFGRNKKEFLEKIKLLMEHNVVVYFRQEQINTEDPQFSAVLGVISAFLEDQRDIRTEWRKKKQ